MPPPIAARRRKARPRTLVAEFTWPPLEELAAERALPQLGGVLGVIDLRAVAGDVRGALGDVLVAGLARPLLQHDVVRLPGDQLAAEVALHPVPRGDLPQDGLLLAADVPLVEAPRVEGAPLRDVDGAGQLPLDLDAPVLRRRVGDR